MSDNTDSEFPGFEFRHYPAGPERDTAQKFYQLLLDLKWLQGNGKDIFIGKLKEARDVAMDVASQMLR